MLIESVIYVGSLWRTPSGFRRYLIDAIGLWSRGRRHRAAWAPHLAKTEAILNAAIAAIPGRRTIVVLGSGPLFDVPLESLASAFQRVLLVDLAHLAVIDARLARHPNVMRVWRDLAPIDVPEPLAFLRDIPDLDWAISVNLLSQIARGAPAGKERQAIDRHLDGLAALPCEVTLVTDRDFRLFDRAGNLVEHVDLLYGRQTPAPDETWLWEVAPFGEEHHETRRVHAVAAYRDWRASAEK